MVNNKQAYEISFHCTLKLFLENKKYNVIEEGGISWHKG